MPRVLALLRGTLVCEARFRRQTMNPPTDPPLPPAKPQAPVSVPVDTTGSHHPEPVDLSAESVAGEEDPGAGLDAEDLVLPPAEPQPPPRKP
jgi:hypothetical protein